MALITMQAILRTTSNLPRDNVINTWAFDDGENPAVWPEAAVDFLAFYNEIRPLYSQLVVQNGHQFRMFKISDPEPRQPVYEETWNFGTAPAGAALPREVAKCISFQGLPSSGVPQARRRGRVFIGPLTSNRLGSDGLPDSTLINGLATAATNLLDASIATGWTWAVWSRASGSGVPVNNGWVDNEWDTQRRRETGPSARTTWEATP